MNRDLQRKDPAEVLQVLPWTPIAEPAPRIQVLETWTDTRYKLLTRVREAERRGRAVPVGSWSRVPGWDGAYSVRMRRLRPDPPGWRRPLLISLGALTALTAFLVAGFFVVSALIGYILMALGAITVFGCLIVLARTAGGGGGISISQSVNIWR